MYTPHLHDVGTGGTRTHLHPPEQRGGRINTRKVRVCSIRCVKNSNFFFIFFLTFNATLEILIFSQALFQCSIIR